MSELGDDSLDPATFMDLPLDAINIITDFLAWDYWETAAKMQNRPRVRCAAGAECEDNPAFFLSPADGEGAGNTARRAHFHVADRAHRRNLGLANLHHIDDTIAREASPWLWNTWVINLASVTRLLRAEIFNARVMQSCFYLQALRDDYVEDAENTFGRERLALVKHVFIGFHTRDYHDDNVPDYFLRAFPGVQHVRKQWEQGGELTLNGREIRPERDGNGERTLLTGLGRKAWAWMTIPGLRLKSLDIQLSPGLLTDVRSTRQEISMGQRAGPLTARSRISVDKLVIRENTRAWLMIHAAGMQTVLANYQDAQELVLDFRIPPNLRDIDSYDRIFGPVTPARLPQCTKLTFRFIPAEMVMPTRGQMRMRAYHLGYRAAQRAYRRPVWNPPDDRSDDDERPLGEEFLQALIRPVSGRFSGLQQIKIVLRTDDPQSQPPYPRLSTEYVPARQRLEDFALQMATDLPHLQTVECMYVDRMRPMEPPVMHFLARVRRGDDEHPDGPHTQVEKAYWNPTRMHGFAENGSPIVHWGLSLLVDAALAADGLQSL